MSLSTVSTAAIVCAIACFIIGLRDKDLRPFMFLVSGLAAMAFFVALVADATETKDVPIARSVPKSRTLPIRPAETQPPPVERKYLKVTSATKRNDYVVAVVQGTQRDVPIQCVVQHKLSKDYIATQTWYAPDDLATEVVIRMPEVFSTASLGVQCFEID